MSLVHPFLARLPPPPLSWPLSLTGRMTDSSGVILGGLDRKKDKLQSIRNLLFAACGTSLYASQYGAKLMRDMGAVDTCVAQARARRQLSLAASPLPSLFVRRSKHPPARLCAAGVWGGVKAGGGLLP